MADRTTIEWTRSDDGSPGATWNPTTGCTKVSSGCDNCYAERITNRFGGPGAFDTVVLHPDRLSKPLHWRKPRRVFVNSMSDLFHKDVPDEFIARVWAVMSWSAPFGHTFQILTKRHGRMRSLLNSPAFRDLFDREYCSVSDWWGHDWDDRVNLPHLGDGPLPHVWLGVSVENQQWADVRIPALLDTPAAVRFLSCEPLLGPVDLTRWTAAHAADCQDENDEPPWCSCGRDETGYLDWVIVGGESGPGARPMHPEWARSLRDQCVAAGVPFLFKQWGEWAPGVRETGSRKGMVGKGWAEGDSYEYMSRVGKHRAGRTLDGRTWDEYPQAVTP